MKDIKFDMKEKRKKNLKRRKKEMK